MSWRKWEMASTATSTYLPPVDVPHERASAQLTPAAQGAIEDHVVVRELTRRIAMSRSGCGHGCNTSAESTSFPKTS
jgi:hypothetical protein